jgi:SAM-dependent methyltransferase
MEQRKEHLNWDRDTIQNPRMLKGGRELGTYERILGFNRKELEKLTILDLGCGPELKFSEGLKESGIHAHVISLSPDFSSKEHTDKARAIDPEATLVAAIGQKLPFKDNTFDRVMGLSVHDHLPNSEAFLELVLEVIRILKDGGTAYFGPFQIVPFDENRKFCPEGYNEAFQKLIAFEEIKKAMKENNVNIFKEGIPGSAAKIVVNQKTGKDYVYGTNRIVIIKGK